jgi:transcriptional regulator
MEAVMRISERVSMILQLEEQGPSDCKIARKINTDPSVTRSRKNAQKKLQNAQIELEWAERIGLSITIS